MLTRVTVSRFCFLFALITLIPGCGDSSSGDSLFTCSVVSYGEEIAKYAMPLNDTETDATSLAQSFLIPETKAVPYVLLKLSKEGSSASDTNYYVTATLHADSGGVPGAALSGAGSTATANVFLTNISQASGFVRFTFPFPVTLSPDTRYWIVLSAGYPATPDFSVKWAAHDERDGYTNGSALYDTTESGWIRTAIGPLRDFLFSIGC